MRDHLNLFARNAAAALQAETRLRLPGIGADAGAEGQAAAHLPGAGWLVGMAACLVFAIFSLPVRDNPWGAGVAAVACTIATLLLTGARHEAVLFRAADGLAQGPPAGADNTGFGVMALVVVLVGKIVLLAALASASEASVMAALFAGHVLSRFAQVAVADWLGSSNRGARDLRPAALWCVVPLLLMIPVGGVDFLLLALLAAALAGLAMVRWGPVNRPGGQGAAGVQQVCELGFYLGAALAA